MVLLSREFIAVPDDKKRQIVFKWPDVRIRKFTRAIVDADEMAVFLNTGQVIGTMGPGRHQIDASELPFLGIFIDAATGGNAYRAELYFIGTREYPGFTFGARWRARCATCPRILLTLTKCSSSWPTCPHRDRCPRSPSSSCASCGDGRTWRSPPDGSPTRVSTRQPWQR